jgi:hypothetical protein
VHVPIPFSGIFRALRGGYSYFRTGVKVEGDAWLCDLEHPPLISYGDPIPRARVPQHVDVELRFWNRRNERITVLEVAEARVPMYGLELTDADWRRFLPLTLEPGAPRQESIFVLLPKDEPATRVEASVGAWLELAFMPSRGSERWARPRFRGQFKVRD